MERIRQQLIENIETFKDEIITLSKEIHRHPELGFKEYHASSVLTKSLEKYGFQVQLGYGSLQTAFKATYRGSNPEVTLAFLAEYDALEGIGHGCGHNLIGPASAFSAIALSRISDNFDGNIVVIGTPAEEFGGGKIILIDEGAFEDIDFAIMSHPSSINQVGRKGRAITSIDIQYFGKSAHSSAPENGINALQAVINTFNNIDQISQTFSQGVNTNGIVLHGGDADNIIPEYASCRFSVRAETRKDLLEALEKIKQVIRANEILLGVKAKYEIEPLYAERYPNMTMEHRYKSYMEMLGEEVIVANPHGKFGSSDIGNVSLIMPIAHTYFKIMDEPVNSHSKEFTEKALGEGAFRGMMKTIKAMTLLGYDIVTDSEFRNKIKEEFQETTRFI